MTATLALADVRSQTVSLNDEANLARATEAYVALVAAHKAVRRLQRDAVLGMGDDDALDAAVIAYRRAKAEAERWLLPEAPLQPDSRELFAGWLLESLRPSRLRAA